MKLSELVAYRNLLESLDPQDLSGQVENKIQHLMTTTQHLVRDFPQGVDGVVTARADMHDAIDGFKQSLTTLKQDIDLAISQLQQKYFADSYHLYETTMVNDPHETILQRSAYITDHEYEWIYKRVQLHSDWHRPGMILRPVKSDVIDHMVDCDPLYLVDQDHELMKSVRDRFNETYVNRLRWYAVSEHDGIPDLHKIPDAQFGLIIAIDFFQFKPFEVIKQYLQEFWIKLGPGGVLGFSFNDCDRSQAVEMAERKFMCYTPGRMLEAMAESMGYEVRMKKEIHPATTWLELKKPGEWRSLKGGQTLAQIIDKSK